MEITEQELQDKIKSAIATELVGINENRDQLKNRLDNTKDELKALKKANDDDIERVAQEKLSDEGKHEDLIKRLRENHTAEIERLTTDAITHKKTADKATADIRVLLVDQGLASLFLKAGVTNPHYLKAAVSGNSDRAIIEDDSEGNPIVTIGGQPLDDYIKGWVETDEAKSFITSGNTGGGSGSEGDGSTDDYEQYFKPGSLNLTKQAELERTDPERYKALKSANTPKNNVLPLSAGGAY